MKIAIMGYGTVGSGVAEVIDTHEKALQKHRRRKHGGCKNS